LKNFIRAVREKLIAHSYNFDHDANREHNTLVCAFSEMILSSQLIHYCFSIVLFLLLCLCFLSQQPVHVITLTPTLPSPVAPMPGASGQLFLPPLLPSPQGLIPTLSGYTPTSPMQVPANLLSPTIMPFPGKGFSSQLVNLTNFVYVFVGVFL